MPADRLLNTLLQHYQDVHDDAKSEQILGTTVHLLTHLSNPLNLGVLTSQLLTAPAVWHRPGFDLSHALRVVSLYNSAALRVREDAAEALERKKNKNHLPPPPPPPPPQQRESGGLKPDDWTRAVVQGADDRSPRWRHLLVLTGVLVGFESNERRTLSPSLRGTLQAAVVTAANLALQTHADDGPLAEAAVVLALNYAFPLLSEHHRARLDCGALLPVLLWAVLREEGCDDGLFLRDVARDVTHAVDGAGGRCSWPQHAPSFAALVERDRRPVMSNMGPLAKILAFAVAHAADAHVVMQAQDDLLRFSHRLLDAWAANRLSTVEPAMAAAQLDPDTLQATWPVLWQVLRKMMFAVVATLQAVMARSLLDPRMRQEAVAVDIAAKSLQILRNIYFISSVNGNDAFQVYTFTYLTSLDIICRNGAACEKFLSDCRPVAADSLTVPSAHLQRTLDLYFLNVAEHMPLALTTEAADALIIKPATSYLNFDGPMSPTMVHIFESAHSAVLSVLSCPQHGALTMQLAPFYIVRLFESFPQRMSARQFRVAFKTVMQMVSPPFPIAAQEPLLGETLLEMLLGAIAEAPTAPLAPEDAEAAQAASTESGGVLQSAQSALVLALVDALPFLPLGLVEEWMAVAARTLHAIEDPRLRRPVRERFWDILVNGEMDVERSAMGVAWWGTKGGRELVLGGGSVEVPMMSGALMPTESSKL